MTDYQKIRFCAQTENNESVFNLRMIRIINDESGVIIEDCFCFFKGDPVFGLVYRILIFVPFKRNYVIII